MTDTPPPQNENSPFYPRSPYGAAKVYSYWMARNCREAYGLFAFNGILLNHESPRRGGTFVTRKISMAVARIKLDMQEKRYLRNLRAIRDWGYAPGYVEDQWLILQSEVPSDFVISAGTSSTVAEFAKLAFSALDPSWEKYVEFDDRCLRPTEVEALIGDCGKANCTLNWIPTTKIEDLAQLMTKHDYREAKARKALLDEVSRRI